MDMNKACGCGGSCGGAGRSERQPASATRPSPEASAAAAMLAQCRELLQDLPAPVYSRASSVLPGGTIGKHLRHLLDHVEAALGATEPDSVIDYDHRERETAVEDSVLVGLGAIDRLRRQLAPLEAAAMGRPVRVRSMLSGDGAEAEHGSTLGRELAFAMHHGLHHQAMIGAICREHGIAVARDFGKAPSTLAYEAGGTR